MMCFAFTLLASNYSRSACWCCLMTILWPVRELAAHVKILTAQFPHGKTLSCCQKIYQETKEIWLWPQWPLPPSEWMFQETYSLRTCSCQSIANITAWFISEKLLCSWISVIRQVSEIPDIKISFLVVYQCYLKQKYSLLNLLKPWV